jgi:hypothetical protein
MSEEKFAFVLMHFEPKLTEIYNLVVKPVVEGKGLRCVRANDYKTNRMIMKEIWDSICQSQVVIADMTGLNPNVMYELGISHTLGKETIMIIQENVSENQKFPFDMAHIRRIQYRNDITEFPRLKNELSDTLDFVLKEVEKNTRIAEQTEEVGEGEIEEAEPEDVLLHSLIVDKRENINELAVTIHSLDFRDNGTEVFISIENETDKETTLLTFDCYAIQGKKQYRFHYPARIANHIPPGVIEQGSISFDPIDPSPNKIGRASCRERV